MVDHSVVILQGETELLLLWSPGTRIFKLVELVKMIFK